MNCHFAIAANSKIGESFEPLNFRFFYYFLVYQLVKKIVCPIKTFANTNGLVQIQVIQRTHYPKHVSIGYMQIAQRRFKVIMA